MANHGSSGGTLDLYVELDSFLFIDLSFAHVQLGLDDPEIVGVVDPNDPDGFMPVGSHLRDLEVKIPMWSVTAPLGFSDQVILYFKSGPGEFEVKSMVFPGPVDPADFPYSLFIDKANLPTDARCEVRYLVKSFNGSVDGSNVRNVTFDTLPPGFDKQLSALLLPDDLPDGKITEAYLASHGNNVELRLPLPLYLDAHGGDVISLYWSLENPPLTGVVANKTVTDQEVVAQDIRLNLSGDVILAPRKDGTFYITYKIRDRAGNESSFSIATDVDVERVPIPELPELAEPEFPDATAFGYINCDHEPWNGVRVRLPFPPGAVALQDEVTLYWQGYETLNGVTPIEGTEGVFVEKVTAPELSVGYKDIIVAPYQPHIEPIKEGSAVAYYRLKKSDGKTRLSYEGLIKITRKLPSGDLCVPPVVNKST